MRRWPQLQHGTLGPGGWAPCCWPLLPGPPGGRPTAGYATSTPLCGPVTGTIPWRGMYMYMLCVDGGHCQDLRTIVYTDSFLLPACSCVHWAIYWEKRHQRRRRELAVVLMQLQQNMGQGAHAPPSPQHAPFPMHTFGRVGRLTWAVGGSEPHAPAGPAAGWVRTVPPTSCDCRSRQQADRMTG